MLQASPIALAALIADCERRRPDEACGLLFGRADPDAMELMQAVSADNVWPEIAERVTRYAIDPLTQLRAEQQAAADGLDLVGFYHSHPRGPAVPSAFDLSRAWPTYIYLIVGFDEPGHAGVGVPRAWALDGGGAFVEHSISSKDNP